MKRVLLCAFLVLGCGDDDSLPACASDGDCEAGFACIDQRCVLRTDSGPLPDSGPICDCSFGEVCRSGSCALDCGDPGAVSCDAGQTCNYATGACVAEGTAGVLTGEGQRCGAGGPLCLPGTECDLGGACGAAPPCFAARCNEDRSICWGASCVAERPAGACAPAGLDRMNMDDFIRGGDGGAVDLEFDDACNAYTVTIISGIDYLRQLRPDGTLASWDGVSNLDMGEVAARRLESGEFGTEEGEGQVSMSYICCETCGCDSATLQGVSRLDREGAESLPFVVTATPSTGDGPFESIYLDTGPSGLTWGRDNTLYVGNVTMQGDLVRANLDTGDVEEVHRLPGRIHASAVFSSLALLVAVEGGTIHRVSTQSDATSVWTEVGEDVTSIVRDPFTGRIYVSVSSARILEFDPQGVMLSEWANTTERGRLAYSADGNLYFLVSAWSGSPQILQYPLPSTL